MNTEEFEGEEFLMQPQSLYDDLEPGKYFSEPNIAIMTNELRGLGCKETEIRRSLVIMANYASNFIQNKNEFTGASMGPSTARKLVEDIQKQARKLRGKIEKAKEARLLFNKPDGTFGKYSVDNILHSLQSLEFMFGDELLLQETHRKLQKAGLEDAPKGGQGDRDLDQLFDAVLAVWQVNGGELRRSNTDGIYGGPTLRFVKAAISDPCNAVGMPLRTDKRIGDRIIQVRNSRTSEEQ